MQSEVCFVALTRPEMKFGVPLRGLAMNVLGTLLIGALMSSTAHTWWRSPMMFWSLGLPVHFVMKSLISRDFHAFRTIELYLVAAMGGMDLLEILPARRAADAGECASSV